MSDFQKLTLKRSIRNFLILCGFILLCYGMVKFELVRYAVFAILTLFVVGECAWALIRLIRWDWWLQDINEYQKMQLIHEDDRYFIFSPLSF